MMYLIGRAGWLWFNQSITPKPSNCWPNVSPAKLMSTSIKSGRPIQNFFRFRAVLGDDCEVTGILDHLSQGAQRDRVILNSEYPFCAYRWHVRLIVAPKNQPRNRGSLSSDAWQGCSRARRKCLKKCEAGRGNFAPPRRPSRPRQFQGSSRTRANPNEWRSL